MIQFVKSIQIAQKTTVIGDNKIKYTANSFVGLVQITYTVTYGNMYSTAKVSIITQNAADNVATAKIVGPTLVYKPTGSFVGTATFTYTITVWCSFYNCNCYCYSYKHKCSIYFK
jgi:hypothetical protein